MKWEVLVVFLWVAPALTHSEPNCKNLDLLFVVDPSSLNPVEIDWVRMILMEILNELENSVMLKRAQIRVAFQSYTNAQAYIHDFVSLKNKEYIERVVLSSMPIAHGRFNFYSAVMDFYTEKRLKSSSNGTLNCVIFITKSSASFFDNQQWVYEPASEMGINVFKNTGIKFFLIQLDKTSVFPSFLYSEPACAHNAYAENPEEVLNLVETIEYEICKGQFVSRTCQLEKSSMACLMNKSPESISVICSRGIDTKSRNETFETFPYEIKTFDQNDLINATWIQIDGFNFSHIDDEFFPEFANRSKSVLLRKSNIRVIDQHSLEKFRNTTTLLMDMNRIEKIQNDSFRTMTSLAHLNLAYNHLRRTSRGMFESLLNLVKLELASNLIELIDDFSFSALTNLKNLTLDRNRLRFLSRDAFYGLEKLEFLLLNQNQLEYLDDMTFKPLKNLRFMLCFQNQLKTINQFLLQPLVNIKWLFISNNFITEFHPDALATLTNLEWLDLNENFLRMESLPRFLSDKLISLQLGGQNGTFTKIDRAFFQDKLSKLSYRLLSLRLGFNEINEIEPGAFKGPSIFNNISQFSISLSFFTFFKILEEDVCNINYFAAQNGGRTVIFIDNVQNIDTSDERMRLILGNCALRILTSKRNIIVAGLRYPAFGNACRNFDYKEPMCE